MLNQATLIGRVGKKDVHALKNGGEMINLSIATNRTWTDQQGVKQEQTTWHNVNFFNKLADVVKRYAHVGNLIYVQGEINHKQITRGEREGQWAYSITGSLIKLLPSPKKSSDSTGEENPIDNKKDSIEEPFDDDAIPF